MFLKKIFQFMCLFCIIASSINFIGIIVTTIQGNFNLKNLFLTLAKILFYITAYNYTKSSTHNKKSLDCNPLG